MQLEVQALLDEASQLAGLSDFGEPVYEAPLSRWVQDMAGPQLSDFGRAFLHRQMVRDLSRRLQVVDFLKQHPEVLEVALPPIVLITGFARTGTTLSHNLMALHPGARTLLKWELLRPLPPPEAATRDRDPRIAKAAAALEPLRGGPLEQMHWVEADDPEECVFGFHDGTGVMGRSLGLAMPRWCLPLWLDDTWGPTTFREYRRMLQILTWKSPAPPGGHLLLKCPQSAPAASAFLAEFPEAKLVLTHRDPYRALSSSAKVSAIVNEPFLASPPRVEPQQMLDILGYTIGAMTRVADEQPGRVAQLRYVDLTRDPLAAVRAVYDALGMPEAAGHDARMRAFLDAQRAGKRKPPLEFAPADRLDHDAVLALPDVRAYCARFDVPKEAQRVTTTR